MATDWTTEELRTAIAVLQKIEASQNAGKWLPPTLFEAHIRTHKRISTELILLKDDDRQIYLARRPTRDEHPSEPYPGQLHVPGVTHLKTETTRDTFQRLREKESLSFEGADLIDEQETEESARGSICLMRIYLARWTGPEPTNPLGAWYPVEVFKNPETSVHADLVDAHKRIIVPALVNHLWTTRKD